MYKIKKNLLITEDQIKFKTSLHSCLSLDKDDMSLENKIKDLEINEFNNTLFTLTT